MARTTTRRRFLANGVAFPLILRNGRSIWSSPANEKLNVALVGAGNRGSWFVTLIPRLGQNLAAVCDVNRKRTEEAAGKVHSARTFQDYRTMLDDVFAELDKKRRQHLLESIVSFQQVLITATELDYFEPSLLREADTLQVRQGEIERA